MNLSRAQSIASRIRTELEWFCTRIEIAGSIRRCRPQVNDIDFAIEPKPGHLARIKERCRERCFSVTDGEKNAIFRLRLADHTEIQLDLFFARPRTSDLLETIPGNFGSVLLCRTGSKAFNIFMIEHAKQNGLTWNPQEGVFDADGKWLAGETEEEIFRALQLDFIPPEKRER